MGFSMLSTTHIPGQGVVIQDRKFRRAGTQTHLPRRVFFQEAQGHMPRRHRACKPHWVPPLLELSPSECSCWRDLQPQVPLFLFPSSYLQATQATPGGYSAVWSSHACICIIFTPSLLIITIPIYT